MSSSTPVTQVQAAPQRNHQSARGSSSGFTFFFVSPSIVPWKGPLTKLKKYSMPIQTIPARMWIQRNKALRISTGLLLQVGLQNRRGREPNTVRDGSASQPEGGDPSIS